MLIATDLYIKTLIKHIIVALLKARNKEAKFSGFIRSRHAEYEICIIPVGHAI